MDKIIDELHKACDDGKVEIVSYILSKNLDMTAGSGNKCGYPRNPLTSAVQSENIDVIVLLLSSNKFRYLMYQYDEYGYTCFHYSIMKGNLKIISLMLFMEPNYIDYIDKRGNSPLQIALKYDISHVLCYFKKFYSRYYLDFYESLSVSQQRRVEHFLSSSLYETMPFYILIISLLISFTITSVLFICVCTCVFCPHEMAAHKIGLGRIVPVSVILPLHLLSAKLYIKIRRPTASHTPIQAGTHLAISEPCIGSSDRSSSDGLRDESSALCESITHGRYDMGLAHTVQFWSQIGRAHV